MTRIPKLLQVFAGVVGAFVGGALLLSTAGCETAAPEPTSNRAPAAAKSAKTLTWTVPPTWNVERTAKSGEYRGKYTIPITGDAKHPAELLVSKLKSGKAGDVNAKLDALLAEFEGEGTKSAKRETFTVGAYKVTVMEVGATYKFPMGPPMGPNQKRAAHVIKKDWRAIAAGVETEDRGNWFFRLVGPNDAVEGSRSAFMGMLKALR